MGFITKQPNGLLTRFSTVCDCPDQWNITAEEYVNRSRHKPEAQEILNHHIRSFDDVLDGFLPNNMSIEDFAKYLKEVGYTEPWSYKE